MSNLVCIKTFANRSEAEIAKLILEDNGIKASVSADDAGGMLGINVGGCGVKLFVLDEDSDHAKELLLADEEVEE